MATTQTADKIVPFIHRPEHVRLSAEQQELVSRIRRQWGDTKQKNIEVGQCLQRLKVPKRAWKLNMLNLPMSYSWARRLIKIATDSRILLNLNRMPDARSTLHEIAVLRDRDFFAALWEGIINPACTRQDIRDFVRRRRGTSVKTHLTVTFEAVGRAGMPEVEILEDMAELLLSIKKMVTDIFPTLRMKKHIIVRPRGEVHVKAAK